MQAKESGKACLSTPNPTGIPIHRHEEIKSGLDVFFANEKNFDVLVKLLNKNDDPSKKILSLRVLEFAAANSHKFCKDIALSGRYQDYLDSAGKRLFDAFRRHIKFEYKLKNRSVQTNTAQLRFIKFSLENGIIKWLKKKNNIKLVELEMRASSVTRKGSKKRKKIISPSVAKDDVVLRD